MTLFSCVMAFAVDAHVSTIADLNAKLADASVETIYLDADLTYTTEACINILRSVTIDGQGHKISGGGIRTGSTKSTMAINQGAPGNENWIDLVTLKNLTLQNAISAGQALNVRCNLTKLVIDNCTIKTTGSGNNQPITFGGNQSTPVEFVVTNSKIDANTAGYPVIAFNPIHMETSNSTYTGYCALYFKAPNGSAGTNGSIVNADACEFNAPNVHARAGGWNNFGTFVFEDEVIEVNLHNCGMNSQTLGDANQGMFLSYSDLNKLNISGDNSHINGSFVLSDGIYNGWFYYSAYNNITITGGTYSVDPSNIGSFDAEALGLVDGDSNPITGIYTINCVPDGYEVKEIAMEGVATPLYRVVKKAAEKEPGVLYDLNDNVQSQGDGQNPTTSFELSDGSAMTLNQATTKAGYVEVSNATTVTVATDQTLVINNGLDVQGASSVVTAQPGSALVIGEGGIVTESSANIVVEANEDGAASLLLDPTITVNQTPELTVKMTVPAEHAGYEMHGSDKYRHWHRFAMPVDHMAATWVKDPDVPTYLYGWNYSAQEWAQVGVTEMVPFVGYTLSPDKEISTNTAVTYTFKGKLLGNTNCTLNLNHHGYNFFGNSYTGYISILKLVDQIMGDAKIDGTVWMWDGEKYQGIGLEYLRQYGAIEPSWKKEVAPMQTFVLRLTGDDYSSTDINYADAIWGNPRYDAAKTALNAAPARQAEINDDAIIRMTIEANGQKESVVLIENGVYSDAYDRGYDAIKYMNENCFNTYVGVNGENYGTVATDILEGKMLNIKTNNELAYSITFDFVAGEEYALRDNLTGNVIAIEEGATYEFAAQPNSTIEGRFEIVSVAKMPTAIENTEVKANVKGIYTLTGQYLGENFEALPAGVYVVNGVKIVK